MCVDTIKCAHFLIRKGSLVTVELTNVTSQEYVINIDDMWKY